MGGRTCAHALHDLGLELAPKSADLRTLNHNTCSPLALTLHSKAYKPGSVQQHWVPQGLSVSV